MEKQKVSLSLPSTSKAMILCAANGISLLLLRVALFFPGKPDLMACISFSRYLHPMILTYYLRSEKRNHSIDIAVILFF